MDTSLFRSILLDKQKSLLDIQETAKQAAQIVALDQTSVGRISRMDALQRQAMAIATNQRNAITLQQIAAALKRIECNQYGRCIECDTQIAESRLKLSPEILSCIDCAQQQETLSQKN